MFLGSLPETHQTGLLNDDGLQELARRLKESQCAGYAESMPGSSSGYTTELRYTKFMIGGIPGVKHAVFIPDNLKLTHSVLEQVCEALDKEMPSMLLCGMSSLCHPAKMSTPQLRKCRGFRQLMNDSKSTLGIPSAAVDDGSWFCKNPGSEDSTELQVNDPELTHKPLIDVANRVLEKKVGCTIRSIASAAYWTNVWTYTGPRITNFEVFLQQCLENNETDVFKMAVGHCQDRAYMEADMSRNLMRYLFDNSHSMSPEVVSAMTPVNLQGDLWHPGKNTQHPDFAEHGFDYWSFESYDETSHGHPLTQWPWPHADLLLLFYREEQGIDGRPTSDADWDFMTKTRYDQDVIPFTPDLLAPVGYVFIGGKEALMKKKLLQAMRAGSPMVILENTPNVPKQVSLLVQAVQCVWQRNALDACRPFLDDATLARLGRDTSSTELLESLLPSKILAHVEKEFDSSGMEETEKLTLSDVVGMMDLVRRRPQVFKERVCVIDPLRTSPDQTAAQLTTVFNCSSQLSGTRELHCTAVHRSLVTKSWRLHRRLAERAKQLRGLVAMLTASIGIVMVVATTLAVCSVAIRLKEKEVHYRNVDYNISAPVKNDIVEFSFSIHEVSLLLRFSLLALPISVGLMTTLQSHFQIGHKWASVHMAADETVSDIYRYLAGVRPYNQSQAMNQRRFMRRLETMVKHLSFAGINEDDLIAVAGSLEDDLFPQDGRALENHVSEYLYGIRKTRLCGWLPDCQCFSSLMSSCRHGHDKYSWSVLLMEDQEPRDIFAPITADIYMEIRVAALRRYYGEWVRRLNSTRAVLHTVLVVSLCIGAGLGASKCSLWIPVALALATFSSSVINWLAPPEMVSAVCSAMTTLNNLDLRWQGSGIRDRSSTRTKEHLICITERLWCAVASTYSGFSMTPEEVDEELFDERMLVKSSRVDTRSSGASRSVSRSASIVVTPYGRSGTTTPYAPA